MGLLLDIHRATVMAEAVARTLDVEFDHEPMPKLIMWGYLIDEESAAGFEKEKTGLLSVGSRAAQVGELHSPCATRNPPTNNTAARKTTRRFMRIPPE
jgi:hypothetical protein